MKINAWLQAATKEFADAKIPSGQLDAEIILAHTINQHRTWLHAHGDEDIDPRRKDIADARAELRLERVPIAYIIGHKEFYGRRFFVSPATLIPRPESEAFIELLKKHILPHHRQLVDVGTGCGCLGITAKLKWPALQVTLLDISRPALLVAKKNAAAHNVDVQIYQSDLLDIYPTKADIVFANLPYVDRNWPLSPDIKTEPEIALFADNDGLALIQQLLNQIPKACSSNALIFIEADPKQHEMVIKYAKHMSLDYIETDGFVMLFQTTP